MNDIDDLLRRNPPTPRRQLDATFAQHTVNRAQAETRNHQPGANLQELFMKLTQLPKLALAILAIIVIGLGTGMYMTARNHDNLSNTTDTPQPSSNNGDAPSPGPDIKPQDISDILQEEAPPANTKADGSAIGLDAVDDKGKTYQLQGVGHDFQIDTKDGKSYESIQLVLITQNVTPSDCTVTHKFVPDESGASAQLKTLPSTAKQRLDVYDGVHLIKATCTTKGKTLTAGLDFRVADNLPKKCKDFSFSDSAETAGSYNALKSGMVGTWEGCVRLPKTWKVPSYYLSIQFKADGTYSAHSDELLDGLEANALYFGSKADSPEKTYALNDFLANNTGSGDISIFFDTGNTNKYTLKNVKLMGSKLSFDLSVDQYITLTYQLYKK